MRIRHLVFLGFACVAAPACADVVSPGPAPAQAAAQSGISIAGTSGEARILTLDEMASLPATVVNVAFGTDKGMRQATFEGPLLWTVLEHAGAIDVTKRRDQVNQIVVITGSDGYTAALAVGEVSPAFEGKQVIVAQRMDGQLLGGQHARVVVPGDHLGGRSVRDVVRLRVISP